jgi:hypothetical protein
MDLSYHKGQKCVISPLFCQEGFCAACAIHLSLTSDDIGRPVQKSQRIITRETHREFRPVEALQSR